MRFWDKLFGKRQPKDSYSSASAREAQVEESPISENAGLEKDTSYVVPPSSPGYFQGKEFEHTVEAILRAVEARFPSRVQVTPQARVALNDGRDKYIDFAFDYGLK